MDKTFGQLENPGAPFLVNDETMTNQFLGWARNQLPSKIPQNLGGGSEIYFRRKDRKGWVIEKKH